MKSVGIKILKNQLSKYINMVREGEVIYVTDRDDIVAEIRKPAPPAPPKSRWEEFLDREEKAGRIVRATKPNLTLDEIMKDDVPAPQGIDWMKILDEVKEDRFP